jgi:hypothetical protein
LYVPDHEKLTESEAGRRALAAACNALSGKATLKLLALHRVAKEETLPRLLPAPTRWLSLRGAHEGGDEPAVCLTDGVPLQNVSEWLRVLQLWQLKLPDLNLQVRVDPLIL